MGQCSCGKSKPSIKISIASTNAVQCTPKHYNTKFLHVSVKGIPILDHPSFNPLYIKRHKVKVCPLGQ